MRILIDFPIESYLACCYRIIHVVMKPKIAFISSPEVNLSVKNTRWLSLLLFLLVTILPARVVLADTGPKPSMTFEFGDLGDLQIVTGILFECDQPDCSDAAPLEELGPQGLYCEATGCRALGYGFAPYHILEIEFSDGVTRRSEIFETAGFDGVYTVTVQPNDLTVKAQFTLGALHPYLELLLTCLCCAVGVILFVALVVYWVRRSRRK